jgi:Tol biopolymer transport system component
MRSDGDNQRRLTFHGGVRGNLAWSPDSKFVAYAAEQGTLQIYLVDVNSLQVTQLTNQSQGVYNYDPEWSPDGRYIAFVSDRDGNFEIYLMQPKGQESVNVTNHSASDKNPAWSLDGRRLAFDSDRSGAVQVYSVFVDESVKGYSSTNIAAGHEPAWSPDGTYLAFVSTRLESVTRAIFSTHASGDAINEALVVNKSAAFRLAWSPDSSKIAFTSSEYIQSAWIDQIWIVSIDGSDLKRLTPTQARP